MSLDRGRAILFLAASFSLSTSCTMSSTAGSMAFDCRDGILYEDRMYCTVPFVLLLTQPERLHGKRIDVYGYLIVEDRTASLFFRETSELVPLVEEALYLELDPKAIEGYLPNMKVRVRGEFFWDPSRRNPRNRTIRNIEEVLPWF